MTHELQLRDTTSLDEILSWPSRRDGDVLVKCGARSEFSFASEAYALLALAAMHARGARVSVEYSTEVPNKRCFDGLFGLALLSTARTVVRARTTDDVRSQVLNELWASVVEQRGRIGTGRVQYLVAREPMQPVPLCLRGAEGFPNRGEFRRALLTILADMKGLAADFWTRAAEQLLTFLFEASQNAYEHARQNETGDAVGGVHGLVIEKLVLNSSLDDVRSRGVDPLIAGYVGRQTHRALVFISMTVVDLGPGIHRTLPAGDDAETDFQKLNRAFRRGTTRKGSGTDMAAGLGLSKLADACANLRALLIVKSGDLMGVRDFAAGTPERDGPMLEPWPSGRHANSPGTAVTLIVPESASQLDLF